MDFSILYAIQGIRNAALDDFFLLLTKCAGSYGQIWLALAAVLLLFKKTRACGIAIAVSYLMVWLLGHLWLKDLIARARPCHIDRSVPLLVSRPSSFSCPSTHAAWAFAAVGSVYAFSRKFGAVTLVLAALIGFSRLYLFVHFPSDVLFGAALGAAFGVASAKIVKETLRLLKAKTTKSPN